MFATITLSCNAVSNSRSSSFKVTFEFLTSLAFFTDIIPLASIRSHIDMNSEPVTAGIDCFLQTLQQVSCSRKIKPIVYKLRLIIDNTLGMSIYCTKLGLLSLIQNLILFRCILFRNSKHMMLQMRFEYRSIPSLYLSNLYFLCFSTLQHKQKCASGKLLLQGDSVWASRRCSCDSGSIDLTHHFSNMSNTNLLRQRRLLFARAVIT